MDIVLRALFAFFFVLLLTRIVGRRELASLQPFDLILLVMIGDLVQQGVTQNDFSVTGLVLAGGTIAVLTVVVSYGSFKLPFLRPVLDGEPVIVVQDGEPIAAKPRAEQDHARRGPGRGQAGGDRVARPRRVGRSRDERPDQLHREVVSSATSGSVSSASNPRRSAISSFDGRSSLAEEATQDVPRLRAAPPVGTHFSRR